MAELTLLRNIGKEMARKLTTVGIDSFETLREAGAKEVYFKLKMTYSRVCLVHLYALEGALEGGEFNSLTREKKRGLKELSGFLERKQRGG